jgi:hypothetical protein
VRDTGGRRECRLDSLAEHEPTLNIIVRPKPDYAASGRSKRLRLATVDGATPNAALLIVQGGAVTANDTWPGSALPRASRMPPKAAAIRRRVYVNAALLEVADSLWPQPIGLVPNLSGVIERSSIIDGRAIPTAPRYKWAWRWRGAAVKEGDRLSKRAVSNMAHESDGVAAPTTATTIPNLLYEVDGKPIATPASGARTDQFAAALTLELQPELGDGIRHRNIWHDR